MNTKELDPLFAAHDTLLGQMQRGLGRVHRAVRDGKNKDCVAELMTCLGANPCMGLQETGVPAYYASIAASLEIDVYAIAALVGKWHPDEWNNGGLAARVLMELILWGHHEAKDALLSALHGDGWLWAAQSFGHLEEDGAVLTDDEFESMVGILGAERLSQPRARGNLPLWRWAGRSKVLRRRLDALGVRLCAPHGLVHRPTVNPSLPTAKLLAMAIEINMFEIVDVLKSRIDAASTNTLVSAAQSEKSALARRIALRVLGIQSNPVLLPKVVKAIEKDTARGRLRTARKFYVQRMPAEAVRRQVGDWGVGPAAGFFMEQCAEARDREWLESQIMLALEGNESRSVWSSAKALGRIADPRSREVLERAFMRVTERPARSVILNALIEIGGYSDLFEDALWDSDPDTRMYAAEYVAIEDPDIVSRLEEMANDAFEDSYVKKEALGALKDAEM